MTTIAYRDGILAADSAMCQGNVIIGNSVKIMRRSDGDMAGAAGDASYNKSFRDWFARGENGEPPKAGEGTDWFDRGVIFRRSGVIDVFEPRGMFSVKAPYFAFGSGKEFALGAMWVGAGASEAVQAAIAHDPYSGGEVLVLKCGVY